MRKIAVLIAWCIACLVPLFAGGQPVAKFTASVTSGCSPLVVIFTSGSTGTITNYNWSFGNGNSSSGATKSSAGAIYYTPGTYSVTLTVSNSSGQKDSITKTALITVFKSPVARFSASPLFGCKPLTVNFLDSTRKGSGSISTWAWDFGDGNSSGTQNPSNKYLNGGKFTVSLLVTDVNGCSDISTQTQLISVSSRYNINFKATDTLGCKAPLTTTFNSILTGGAGTPSYYWQFGDGDSSSSANPSHTYLSLGQYSVTLTVKDPSGCAGTIVKRSYINTGTLKAGFSPSITRGCPPLKVSFSNTSNAQNGSKYSWDFGDGVADTNKAPVHAYKKAGKYGVRLVVKDTNGCSDTLYMPNSITVLQAPVADFTANDSIFCRPPLKINFIDKSSRAISWAWSFGDTNTSSSQNPVHTYASVGNYTIKLIVTASNGCTDTALKPSFIKISPPVASFIPVPYEGCAPVLVKFNNTTSSKDSVVRYHWDFGTGDTSNQRNPSYTFKSTGKYKVSLTVYTKGGCSSGTYYYPIKAGVKPQAGFSATPTRKCIDSVPVVFTNLTNTHSVQADSFFWQFGDGQTATTFSPSHIYNYRPGKLPITLVAWNNGCADTLKIPDYIELLPAWANFSHNPPPCKSDTIQFFDNSVRATSIWWKFDNTDSTTTKNPQHSFSIGTHTAEEWAYNDTTGCLDSQKQTITISPKLLSSFKANDTVFCQPFTVQFSDTENVPISAYSWDFGNGKTGSTHNPSVSYDSAGFFTVSLTATDANGCSQTVSRKNYIHASRPLAKFSISPDAGCTPIQVHIIDSSTSAIKLISRYLDMGNGTIIKLSGNTLDYTYSRPPRIQKLGYKVKLKIIDSMGCADSTTVTIHPSHPKPDFTIKPSNNCSTLDYYFFPAVSDTDGYQPFRVFWTFGDGTNSHSIYPHPTYGKSGAYQVKLKVIDANYCPDSITKTFTAIKKPPKAAFAAAPTFKNCPPLQVKFTDSSLPSFASSKIVAWKWTFGDGSGSSIQNPSKIYNYPGVYNVSLVVTDSGGCTDSVMKTKIIAIRGPTGTFKFDKNKGCPPLTVNFNGTSRNAKDFIWDMGDGNILSGNNISNTYTYAGVFHPSLVLTDSFGCKVALPPRDSIVVDPFPETDFNWSRLCFDYPTFFRDSSTAIKGTLTKYNWDFGDSSGSSALAQPKHIFRRPGLFRVTHTATNTTGCTTALTKTVKIGGLKVNMAAQDSTVCLGTQVNFIDKTFADTLVQNWVWSFGDSDTTVLKNPSHFFRKTGYYNIFHAATDYKGCYDSLTSPKFIIIGDTTAPPVVPIYRTTVQSNSSTLLEFSSCRRIDFDRYIIYRDDGHGFVGIKTTRLRNDTTFLDGSLNTRKQSYCYKVQVANFCDFKFPIDSSREHCTINLAAKPAINAAILNWSPYIGWDSVRRYFIYRTQADSNNFGLLDSIPGAQLNYIDTTALCYQPYTYQVRATQQGGFRQESYSDTAATLPIHKPNAKPNELVRATVINSQFSQLDWNSPAKRVRHYFIEKSTDGLKYDMISGLGPLVNTYVDKDVNVNKQPYYYRMYIEDSCGDLSSYSNYGKTIFLQADTGLGGRPHLHWTAYEQWSQGVDYYVIEIKNKNGSFTNVGQVGGAQLSFDDISTDLNSLPHYCYRVTAFRKENNAADYVSSTSNEACTHVVSFLECPTAFTPNKDLLNDFYLVKGIYIADFHLKIFNRWGALVFESYDINAGWDGTFKGKACPMDVYIYQVDATGADDQKHFKQGNITLLK